MAFQRSRSRASSMYTAARIGVIGLAALGAGCASQQASTSYPGDRLGGPPVRVAAPPKVEIEDDGLPAQIALRHRRPVADDPSEPWSPNYGGAPAKAVLPSPQPTKSAAPLQIKTAPTRSSASIAAAPLAIRGTGTRLSALDEEDIIRRAVAAHEMRRND